MFLLMTQVTKNKKWSDLGRILGYSGIPGLSTQLKNSYTRVILPFEHFCERVKNSPSMSPLTRDPQTNSQTNGSSPGKLSRMDSTATIADDTSPPPSPLTATSSPLSEPPDEAEYRGISGNRSTSSKPRKSARMGSQGQGFFFLCPLWCGSLLIAYPSYSQNDPEICRITSRYNRPFW
jgi:histone demethylase JARID1